MVIRILPLCNFVNFFYNLYDEIAVNYFAHAHTKYTRPPFSSQPGIEARRLHAQGSISFTLRLFSFFNEYILTILCTLMQMTLLQC